MKEIFKDTNSYMLIIAFVALISPMFVAIINNIHHTKIRKLEMKQDLKIKIADVYYADKKNAFDDFATAAGNYSLRHGSFERRKELIELQKAADKAMLFCKEETKNLIYFFIEHCNEIYKNESDETTLFDYRNKLFEVLNELNNELTELRVNDLKK